LGRSRNKVAVGEPAAGSPPFEGDIDLRAISALVKGVKNTRVFIYDRCSKFWAYSSGGQSTPLITERSVVQVDLGPPRFFAKEIVVGL
jgi:hypothetical protein